MDLGTSEGMKVLMSMEVVSHAEVFMCIFR